MGVDTVSEMEQWSGVASRCWGKVFHDGQTLKIEAPFLASPVGSSAPRKIHCIDVDRAQLEPSR